MKVVIRDGQGKVKETQERKRDRSRGVVDHKDGKEQVHVRKPKSG